MIEGAGVSISSLFFSLVEVGILTSQIIFLRKYWKLEEFRTFIIMTSLFLFLNITLLLISVESVSHPLGTSLVILNSLTIGIYLFFMNINTLLPKLNYVQKIPWLLISVSLSFGVHGLLKTFEVSQNDFTKVTNLGVPVLFVVTVLILILAKAGERQTSWNTFWFILLVFTTMVFASFLLYLEEQLHFVSYLYINFVFLLFSAMQFWQLKLSNGTVLDSQVQPPVIEESATANQVDELSEFGLSKTEREIIEELLEGASYNEIAKKRIRSYSAISSQASNAFSKLGVHSQEELLEKFKSRR